VVLTVLALMGWYAQTLLNFAQLVLARALAV
jgi:type III secretory pathway component EscS